MFMENPSWDSPLIFHFVEVKNYNITLEPEHIKADFELALMHN